MGYFQGLNSDIGNDEDVTNEESGHFRPDAWTAAWEAAQDGLAPSPFVKRAAEKVVSTELLQQSLGWMLLTHFGILLGSFAQAMTQSVCLLGWGIFMLEAGLKLGRNWAHANLFRDVPCAYVPIHQEAARNSLSLFAFYLFSASSLEVVLYVPYLYAAFSQVHGLHTCRKNSDQPQCTDGVDQLLALLVISACLVVLHWLSSILAVLKFNAAMGIACINLMQSKWIKEHKPGDHDRLLCLTWWVHIARHRHLSAAVASAQSGACGLPGHWFQTAGQLKRIVSESVSTRNGPPVFDNSGGPACVSTEMALRAMASIAKQGHVETCRQLLRNNGFDVLVQVVKEGKPASVRGLGASVIAVLATQSEFFRNEEIDLSLAVVPLKRLARSKEVELKEVALGALLNSALNLKQSSLVLSAMLGTDELAIGDGKTNGHFVDNLLQFAHRGPTTRCQELAVGLIARLAAKKAARTIILQDHGSDKCNGVELCIWLLENGLTVEVRSSAAGVLSELAYWEGKAVGGGAYGKACIETLIAALRSEHEVAEAAARALSVLGYNNTANKHRIVQAGGIKNLVEVLEEPESLSIKGQPGERKMQILDRVQSEVAKALWILAIDNDANKKSIADLGAIPHLARVLLKKQAKIHMNAAAALSALAVRNKSNQDIMGEDNLKIIPRLVQLLDPTAEHDMLEAVLEKCALAVKNIAEGHRVNRELFLKAGAKQQLELILKYRDKFKRGKDHGNKLHDLAGKALDMLNSKQD